MVNLITSALALLATVSTLVSKVAATRRHETFIDGQTGHDFNFKGIYPAHGATR